MENQSINPVEKSEESLGRSTNELTPLIDSGESTSSKIFNTIKATLVLSLLLFFYVSYSEATNHLSVGPKPYKKPWMINWVAGLGSSIALPLYIIFCRVASLINGVKYVPVDWSGQLHKIGSNWEKIIFWSVVLSLAFNIQAYTFDYGLQTVPASTVIAIFSGLSAGVVYFLSLWLLPHEKFSLLKIIAIVISIGGVCVYAYVDRNQKPAGGGKEWVGILSVVVCSVVYPIWAVGLCVALGGEENLALTALFTSLVGIEALLYIPVFSLLNFTGIEILELPSRQVLGAFFISEGGNIGMNIAWIFSLVIVSPIWTSIVTMLAMPVTGLYDHFFNGTDFPFLKICGSVAILIGFAIVNLPEPKMFAWDNIKRKFSAQDTTE